MSAHAVSDLHSTPIAQSSPVPVVVGGRARSGGPRFESEPPDSVRRPDSAPADRLDLEPHWLATIAAATD